MTLAEKRIDLRVFNKPANHEDSEGSRRTEQASMLIRRFVGSAKIELDFKQYYPGFSFEAFFSCFDNFTDSSETSRLSAVGTITANLISGRTFTEFLKRFGEQLQDNDMHPEFGECVEINDEGHTLGESLNQTIRTHRWVVVTADSDGYFPDDILAEVSGEYMDETAAIEALDISVVERIDNSPHGCHVVFNSLAKQAAAWQSTEGSMPRPPFFALIEF